MKLIKISFHKKLWCFELIKESWGIVIVIPFLKVSMINLNKFFSQD